MREVRRQSEIAERRQAMGFDGIVGKRGKGAPDERRQRAARAGFQRRPAGQAHGHRIVRLMARFARCTAPERSSPASAAKTRRGRDADLKQGLNFVHEARSRWGNLPPLPSSLATVLYMRAWRFSIQSPRTPKRRPNLSFAR